VGRVAAVMTRSTSSASLMRLRSLVSRAARCARANEPHGSAPSARAPSKRERPSAAHSRVTRRGRRNADWQIVATLGPRASSSAAPRSRDDEETRLSTGNLLGRRTRRRPGFPAHLATGYRCRVAQGAAKDSPLDPLKRAPIGPRLARNASTSHSRRTEAPDSSRIRACSAARPGKARYCAARRLRGPKPGSCIHRAEDLSISDGEDGRPLDVGLDLHVPRASACSRVGMTLRGREHMSHALPWTCMHFASRTSPNADAPVIPAGALALGDQLAEKCRRRRTAPANAETNRP
jgi:hypothetical protein